VNLDVMTLRTQPQIQSAEVAGVSDPQKPHPLPQRLIRRLRYAADRDRTRVDSVRTIAPRARGA
jgi:hypothetical protein